MLTPGQLATALTVVAASLSAAVVAMPNRVEGARVSVEPGSSVSVIVVDRDDLRVAMTREVQQGYNTTATTNAGRFFAKVVLSLASDARSEDPDGPPMLIRHQDWFRAFLDVNRLSEEEAPQGSKLAFQYKQDVLVDYRSGKVVKTIVEGAAPLLALNIQISWPPSSGLPDRYSYEDTTSTPRLNVTNNRVIRFRLLDFGDMIAYDEIEGITGRPVSGLLAPLFALIGDGHLVWSRLAISESGIQVACAKVKKSFLSVTETVSVYPDGTAEKGVSEDAPELEQLVSRLKEAPEIEYQDWSIPDR